MKRKAYSRRVRAFVYLLMVAFGLTSLSPSVCLAQATTPTTGAAAGTGAAGGAAGAGASTGLSGAAITGIVIGVAAAAAGVAAIVSSDNKTTSDHP
jgi:hypothetical protein